MSAVPHDYVSDHGRLTTNTVEGFHGMALVYRGKRTDLCHTHYVCKTNMAICHKVSRIGHNTIYLLKLILQNLGPIWKAFCFASMGVDMPADAVASILREQQAWTKDRQRKSNKENLYRRWDLFLIKSKFQISKSFKYTYVSLFMCITLWSLV